jgi:hypothetical protein
MLSAIPAHEGELIDARVVEDALAFIDAFYTTTAEPGASSAVEESRGVTDTTADSFQGALGQLYHKLLAVNLHIAIEKTNQSTKAEVSEFQRRLDVCRQICLELLHPPCLVSPFLRYADE